MVTTNQITRVLQLARAEVGNNYGGEKFWSWYGFPSWQDWCACFTSWCLAHAGVNCGDLRPYIWEAGYPSETNAMQTFINGNYDALISKGCTQMLTFYEAKGWKLSNNEPAMPGDIILYEWYEDEGPADGVDHVGIIEWVEGADPDTQVLHVIEGNWGNNVSRTTYNYRDYRVWAICRPNYDLGGEDPDYEEFGPDYTEFENYSVVYGDTLGEIAVRHGFTVSELLTCNDIPNPNLLHVGDIIKIPITGRRNWIALFQQAINSAGIATLSVTGTWNTSTETAASNAIVQSGTSGPMATFAQTMLLAYGYSLPMYGADGDFGSESIAATVNYQSDHNLVADGIIGLNTWKSMLLVD